MTRLAVVEGDARARADARRALLADAMRSGDPRRIARAASRARLLVLPLEQSDAEQLRHVRRRLGRSIRLARTQRVLLGADSRDDVTPFKSEMTTKSTRKSRPPLAVVALGLIVILAVAGRDAPFATIALRDAALTSLMCARLMDPAQSPGTIDTFPVAAPEYYGSVASQAMSAAPGLASYRAAPIQNGFARLIGRVVDDASGLPLDDACLVFVRGSRPIQARTDSVGMFAIDFRFA